MKKIVFTGIFAVMLVLAFFGCNTGNNGNNGNNGNRHTHTWAWAETTVWGMETGTCNGCTETRLRLSPDMMAQIPAKTNITMTNSLDTSDSYIVNLSAFKIGKYEVTQAQYKAVTGNNPSYFTTDAAAGEVQEKRPVEEVTWYDAVEFCNKLSVLEGLETVYTISGWTTENGYPIRGAAVTADFSKNGYRLPTEAQWEYACRAGSTGDYSKDILGNEVTYTNLGEYAWYYANTNLRTHEVGKRTANAFGLYDMHGNVYEWCWDWYGAYPSAAETDYVGASSGTDRVYRGGYYFDIALRLRSAYRSYLDPDIRVDGIGFRLARPQFVQAQVQVRA